MKQVNLSEFDFTQPYVARSYKSGGVKYDGYVGVGIKGRNRKNSNTIINLSGLFKRAKEKGQHLDYEKMSIGVNKFSKKAANVVIIFDNHNLPSTKINTSTKAGVWYANSKGLNSKILNAFGIAYPDVPGTAVRFYFDMEKVDGMHKTYVLVPQVLERVDAFGQTNKADLQLLRSNKLDIESTVQA